MAAAISLEWVLGISPSAIHALTAGRFAYMTGNVGVVFDPQARTQLLLKGHRNGVRASAVSPDRRLLATACAGHDSSVIFWDAASGAALAMIDSPHPLGAAGLDFSADGRFLVTLSMPFDREQEDRPLPKPKEGSERVLGAAAAAPTTSKEQEVSIWDCSALLKATPMLEAEGDSDATTCLPTLLCSAAVPLQAAQSSVCVSRFPLPLAVGRMHDVPTSGGGLLTVGFEFATTGAHSCVFWCATCVAVKDDEAGAALRHKLKLRMKGAAPSEADLAAVALAARSATKTLWAIACAVPVVPVVALAAGAIDKKTGRPLPPTPRLLTSTAFLPGLLAAPLGTLDETVQTLPSAASLLGSVGGTNAASVAALAATAAGSKPTAVVNKEMVVPPTGALICAASATGDGSLVLWRLSSADGGASELEGSIAAAAQKLVHKECLKIVRLTRPETLSLVPRGAVAEAAASTVDPAWTHDALNLVLASPSGRHVIVGSEDGAVRIYDLNMRLHSYFEDLESGPITALSFAPQATTSVPLPSQRLADGVPDLLVCTRRSLVVALRTASFEGSSGDAKRGEVVLECPDARVVGLAAYPHSAALALAIGSGCVQLWDSASKRLLLVRELLRAPDQRSDPMTGAPRPRLYEPTCITADPLGRFLAVGTRDGYILLLDPADLSDAQPVLTPPHWPRNNSSDGAITRLTFSPDGFHLASANEGRHVALHRFTRLHERRLIAGADESTATSRLGSRRPWDSVVNDSEKFEQVSIDAWAFVGRVQSHSLAVTGLSFTQLPTSTSAARGPVLGLEDPSFWPAGVILGDKAVADRHAAVGLSMLASVGHDARLVVYDVGSSSVSSGLKIRGQQRTRIEQFGHPLCCAFEPPGSNEEDNGGEETVPATARLLLATDLYKFKEWDCAGLPQCVRTAVAPTFGGAVTGLAFLPSSAASSISGRSHYAVAYATSDRVVGVISLPLTGNPFGVLGVVGHTGAVADIAASHDGRHFFTSAAESDSEKDGSSDSVGCGGGVSIWAVSEDKVAVAAATGGSGITPFLSLLGGAGGEQYTQICDFFSYAQVHAQGEASTQARRAGTSLPVVELAAVMRALGFFPTAEELSALTTEARRAGGQDSLDLSTLVRLFVNHR